MYLTEDILDKLNRSGKSKKNQYPADHPA